MRKLKRFEPTMDTSQARSSSRATRTTRIRTSDHAMTAIAVTRTYANVDTITYSQGGIILPDLTAGGPPVAFTRKMSISKDRELQNSEGSANCGR